MLDIYFDKNYGKLYETIEKGVAKSWEYNGIEGNISTQFIFREIPIKINGQIWYDIITPYGYGGPIINKINDGFNQDNLVSAFEQKFSEYCEENNIVSEFIRFHPILNNEKAFENIYDIEHIRNTLGTNLEFEDPITVEFSKSCRKNIRQVIKKGVSWRVTPNPKEISIFKEIYYSTMDRNKASEFYYFDENYFKNCQKYFNNNLLLVEAIFEEKTIAAGFYFIYNNVIHAHLSGTLTEYLSLSPAYILKYATAIWGKENGYKIIHYGGGVSNSIDDALYLFKKKFSQQTEFKFCIGKKIWNKEIYEKLCMEKGVEGNITFFPAYRSK